MCLRGTIGEAHDGVAELIVFQHLFHVLDDIGVIRAVDCDSTTQRTGLVQTVVFVRTVPVDVVFRQVQQYSRIWANVWSPVQLEAGQLCGQDLDTRLSSQCVVQSHTNVAHSCALLPEHGGQHGGGCGLAVSAGDYQPGTFRPPQLGTVAGESQRHIAEYRDTGLSGGAEQRTGRTPPWRGHNRNRVGKLVASVCGRDMPNRKVSGNQCAESGVVYDDNFRTADVLEHRNGTATGNSGSCHQNSTRAHRSD